MNQPTPARRLENSHWDPKFPFDLVVAYDDKPTRQRAMQLYDRIAQQLIDDYDLQCSWWKFNHLANPILQQESADAAVDANMVILSIRPHRELPAIHKVWLEDWVSRRNHRKAALVVMVADSSDPEADARQPLMYLRNLARVGRMDFFLHGFELPKPSSDIPLVALPDRVTSLPPAEHAMWHHKSPIPRWGINE